MGEMRGVCIILFIVRSSCIGDLWVQVPGLRVKRCASGRTATREIASEFRSSRSLREERKLIWPSSNHAAHTVARRDDGCWWESHKSIIPPCISFHPSSILLSLATLPETLHIHPTYRRTISSSCLPLSGPCSAALPVVLHHITCKPAACDAALEFSVLHRLYMWRTKMQR